MNLVFRPKIFCGLLMGLLIFDMARAVSFQKAPLIPTSQPDAQEEKPASQAEHYIIVYKDKDTKKIAAAAENLRRKGAKIKRHLPSLNAIAVTMTNAELQSQALNPEVRAVVPDLQVFASLQQSVPLIGADQVQTLGISGAGVKLCIIDTGIDKNHPALPLPVAETDLVNNDNDASDDQGHGSHVAGIIASKATTNKGVAPGASLMVAKVLDSQGSGYSSDVIAGIDWCVSMGAKVINLSLGGGKYPSSCDSEPVAQAANNAVNQGVTVVVAAGNEGFTADLAAPACASKVIAVGAVDKDDGRTPYSNEGKELDIVAPGTDITSAKLGGGFITYSGTSMATPHAAGAVALLLEADASLSPDAIRSVITRTSVDLGTSGFDTIFGWGRLDVLAAHQAVVNGPAQPAQVIFSDEFATATGLAAWQQSGVMRWSVRAAAERGIPDLGSDNTVAHADNCKSGAGCVLTLAAPLDLRNYTTASLQFFRYVDEELVKGEYLRVEVFNGSSWVTLRNWSHRSGDDDMWHEEQFDLSSYLGVSNFKVRFIAKSGASSKALEIDTVKIMGVPRS